MKLLRNQNGAGLMLASVAMAALGGAAMMMGDIFTNAEAVIKKDQRVISYQLLVDSVRKNLYAGNNCTKALGTAATGVNPGLLKNVLFNLGGEEAKRDLDKGVVVPKMSITLDSEPISLETKWVSKSGTSIKGMRLLVSNIVTSETSPGKPRVVRYPASLASEAALSLDNDYKKVLAANMYLVIEPDHKGINVWSKENQKFWIKLYGYINAVTGEIESCFDPGSEAIFCTENMQGTYISDPALNLSSDKRCRPDVGCFTYKSGLIPAGTQCPNGDYKETQISTQFKTCTWCPAEPYKLSELLTDIGAMNLVTKVGGLASTGGIAGDLVGGVGAENFFDLSDLEDMDCSASNPYAHLSQEEAWDAWTSYNALRSELTEEQYAQYAGCLNFIPPCYDPPETCQNECTGDTSACNPVAVADTGGGTTPTVPTCVDDPNTCNNECTGDRSACPCVDDPNTCQNECTGDRSSCPVRVNRCDLDRDGEVTSEELCFCRNRDRGGRREIGIDENCFE